MSDTVRFGIIGSAGLIGNHHANILTKGEGRYGLTALCDIDESRLAEQKAKLNLPGWSDYREFLAHAELDAVVVATPHPLHAEHAIAAAESGKAVLVEKTLAQTPGQARAMISAFKKHKTLTSIHFQQRGNPAVQKARQMIRDGELGRLLSIRTTGSYYKSDYYYTLGGWRGLWDREGGATCINQAPHDIDVMCFLAAEAMPAEITAHWANLFHPTVQAEDYAVAFGRFANNVEFTLQVSVAVHGDGARHELFGTAGALRLGGGKIERYARYEQDLIDFARTYAGPNPYANPKVIEQAPPETAEIDPAAIHKALAEAVLSRDASKLLVPADQGMWSQQVINGVYLSEYRGNRRVTLPIRPNRYDKMLADLIAKAPAVDRAGAQSQSGMAAITHI